MNNLQANQVSLSIAIAKREGSKASLERYRKSVAALTQAEQTSSRAESEAQAQLEAATMAKVKGEPDTTANARTVYQNAMADLAVAETENRAGKRVLEETEQELQQLTRSAHRAAIEVAKAIAADEDAALILAARRFGAAMARRKSLIRFASAASASSGLIADPVSDLNANNPLLIQIDSLVAGTDLDVPGLTEQSLLDAKTGGAA